MAVYNSDGTGKSRHRRHAGLLPSAAIAVLLLVFCASAAGTAAAQEAGGVAALTGLTVDPVAGDTSSLVVSWDAVAGTNEYVLAYGESADDLPFFNYVENTNTNTTIYGLEPDTTYYFTVTASDYSPDPLARGNSSGTTLDTMGEINVTKVV
ncbi:MAG: fibronectin type III domain-containing protein, partial [Desulfovibrionales bacterium]|nr:fibronectin type III domain-containing protein [Desulfovibrionales bacterium]